MMQVNIQEVQDIFQSVINNKMTREGADRWAYKRIQSFDNGDLDFVPNSDEDKIWDALQYLYGIDLQDSPGEYLHNEEDIEGKYLSIFSK